MHLTPPAAVVQHHGLGAEAGHAAGDRVQAAPVLRWANGAVARVAVHQLDDAADRSEAARASAGVAVHRIEQPDAAVAADRVGAALDAGSPATQLAAQSP